MRAEKHEIKPQPTPPTPPQQELSEDLPEFGIQITAAPIRQVPREMRAKVSIEQVDNLRALWGGGIPGIERSAVDRMAAIGRGEPDPGPWIQEPQPGAEAGLVDDMAELMRQSIDEEVDRAGMDVGLEASASGDGG